MNSIQHILQRREMQQKILQSKHVNKQAVSKYILRQRKIPEHIWKAWVNILKVPKEWIVDDTGYCRKLTDDEVLELDKFLEEKELDFSDEGLPGMELWREMYDQEAWIRNIRYRIGKAKNALKDAIYRIPREITDQEEILHHYERNLKFYENIIGIHTHGRVTEKEWDYIFKALFMLTSKESNIQMDEVSSKIYNILKENRDRVEQKRQEDIEFYKENFGEIPEENTEEV